MADGEKDSFCSVEYSLVFASEGWALRPGQALFNAAHDCNPELARAFAGTHVDPFYNDDRISLFLAEVAEY